MKMRLTISLAAALAILVGCAQQPSSSTTAANRNQCFLPRFVNGFAAPDDQTLYVRVGVNDIFRFEMFGRCLNMDWHQRLGLVARPGPWICSGMDAQIITRGRGVGRQTCFVSNMRKLTPEEIAALPPRSRP
jgi:hypothetical protein